MKRKRRTKIVATLGPATDDEAVLRQMIEAGVDVLRLNFSHGDRETHARRIATARRLAQEAGRLVALLQDLQGPKIRVGIVTDDSVELREGSRLVLTTRSVAGTAERISISHAGLPQEVRPGDRVLLDDGALELQVRRTRRHEVECIVVRGGTLRSHKGVNIPGVALSAPALTVKDEEDLRFGLAQGVDMVALSFVRRPSDVHLVRRVVSKSASSVPILAKIEKPEALRHLDGIIRAFDGVMVARGDLGIELSPEKVPAAQKRIIRRANLLGKPVITATQMLESMTHSPQPTRAEASDVANAVLDGSDAVMLSGETAIGEYPAETVKAMDRIVVEAEAIGGGAVLEPARRGSRSHALCHAAVMLAAEVGAAALAAFTRSGRTARILSKLRPTQPIFAFCERESTARELCLWRGVVPVIAARQDVDAIGGVAYELRARRLISGGADVVVVGAAPDGPAGRTNFVRLVRVS